MICAMNEIYLDDEEEQRSFFQRHRWGIVLTLALLTLAGVFLPSPFSKGAPTAKRPSMDVVRVSLPPPPPPPPSPPPPRQEPPPETKVEEKMIEQEAVEEDEPKPEQTPPDEPPAAPDLSTGIAGNGPPDGFGLGGPGGGGRGGNGLGGSGRRGGGSKFGWYAAQVQTRIADALRNNARTSRASARLEVRIWPDDTGRITRARLARSTGDAALDRVIESEVLTGLRLSEPPPADMPRPIVLRITARRPD